jgi:uncharacterized membrane protein
MGWTLHPGKLSVIGAVTKRLVPYLVEATFVPLVLFYVFLISFGLTAAFLAAAGWTYSAVVRRLVGRRPIPALLVLSCLGITMRTALYLLSGNAFVYFVQPILRTALTAIVLGASVLIGRPLIARFASDFCPLTPDVQGRPGIAGLFRRLTYLWAGVNLVAAAVSELWSALFAVGKWDPLQGHDAITGTQWFLQPIGILLAVAIQSADPEHWVSTSELANWLGRRNPDWQKAIGPLLPWCEAFLLGLLQQLKVVEAAKDDNRWFVRLTALGRGILNGGTPTVAMPIVVQTLLVQPNLEVVLYRQGLTPALVVQLTQFANALQSQLFPAVEEADGARPHLGHEVAAMVERESVGDPTQSAPPSLGSGDREARLDI